VDALLSTFAAVHLNAVATKRFLHGQRLRLDELTLDDALTDATEASRVRVYGDDGRLLGVANARDGVLAPERLVVTTAS
jgi:tRNA pseudouridine55 synthase